MTGDEQLWERQTLFICGTRSPPRGGLIRDRLPAAPPLRAEVITCPLKKALSMGTERWDINLEPHHVLDFGSKLEL